MENQTDQHQGQGESVAPGEPVWFVRTVLLLFFAAFAGYLAREVWAIANAIGS